MKTETNSKAPEQTQADRDAILAKLQADAKRRAERDPYRYWS